MQGRLSLSEWVDVVIALIQLLGLSVVAAAGLFGVVRIVWSLLRAVFG